MPGLGYYCTSTWRTNTSVVRNVFFFWWLIKEALWIPLKRFALRRMSSVIFIPSCLWRNKKKWSASTSCLNGTAPPLLLDQANNIQGISLGRWQIIRCANPNVSLLSVSRLWSSSDAATLPGGFWTMSWHCCLGGDSSVSNSCCSQSLSDPYLTPTTAAAPSSTAQACWAVLCPCVEPAKRAEQPIDAKKKKEEE